MHIHNISFVDKPLSIDITESFLDKTLHSCFSYSMDINNFVLCGSIVLKTF